MADIYFYGTMITFLEAAFAGQNILEKYPLLQNVYNKVKENQNIKTHVDAICKKRDLEKISKFIEQLHM